MIADMLKQQRTIFLETERICTFPLSKEEMRLYMTDGHALERSLGLLDGHRQITPELTDALAHSIVPKVEGGEEPIEYVTLWTIVSKDLQMMVGDWCFKGGPGFRQDVEIGYGTYPEFQGRGFMAETMRIASDWALRQKEIMQVLAETKDNNIASHRVLQKAGFHLYREERQMMFWRKIASLK